GGAKGLIELPPSPLWTRNGGAEPIPEFRLQRAQSHRTAAAAGVDAVAGSIAAQHVLRRRIGHARQERLHRPFAHAHVEEPPTAAAGSPDQCGKNCDDGRWSAGEEFGELYARADRQL